MNAENLRDRINLPSVVSRMVGDSDGHEAWFDVFDYESLRAFRVTITPCEVVPVKIAEAKAEPAPFVVSSNYWTKAEWTKPLDACPCDDCDDECAGKRGRG